MRRKKISKLISIVMFVLMVLFCLPVSAASVGSTASDPSLGQDVVQSAQTEYDEVSNDRASTDAFLTVDDSDVVVSVPTTVILSGSSDDDGRYIGEYTVGVSGNISGDKQIVVEPKSYSVDMIQSGKIDKTATITQTQTLFSSEDLSNNVTAKGSISAVGLTAGSWTTDSAFIISSVSRYSLYSSLELAASDANNLTTDNADVLREDYNNAEAAMFINDDKSYITLLNDAADVPLIDLTQNTEINLNRKTVNFADGAYFNSNADFRMYNGNVSGTNSSYIVNENLSTSTVTLSNLDINLDFNVSGNSFAVYSQGCINSLNNVNFNLQGDSSGTIGAFVLSKTEDSVNTVSDCIFAGKNTTGGVRLVQTKGIFGIQNCSFDSYSDSGQVADIYNSADLTVINCDFSDETISSVSQSVVNYNSAIIKNCEFYTCSDGTTANIYDIGKGLTVSGCVLKNYSKGALPIYIESESGNIIVSDSSIYCRGVTDSHAIYVNEGNAEINNVDIDTSTSKSSGSGSVGINIRGGETNIYKANVVSIGPNAMGVTCAETGVLNIVPENSDDVYVYGEVWGLTTRAVEKNALTIEGGTYVSANHVAYIGSNADIENANFYSEGNDGNGSFYFGSENCPADAVIDIRNCVVGTPDKAPCYRFCFVSQTNYGYQDPVEVNIYDCDVYQGTYSIFSYNGSNNNQTKFNIYGDTHFYKLFDAGASQWTEYSKSDIDNLLSNWKTTIYANKSVGNHFVMSYGTVENGVVVSIPVQETANIYDYRF